MEPQFGSTDDRVADPDLEALDLDDPLPDDDRPVLEDLNELVPEDQRGEGHGA